MPASGNLDKDIAFYNTIFGDHSGDSVMTRKNTAFIAKYACIIYIKLTPNGRLALFHCHIDVSGQNNLDNYIKTQILAISTAVDRDERPETHTGRLARYNENFEYLQFNSPHHVYVYVDNDNVEFNSAYPLFFLKKNLPGMNITKNMTFYNGDLTKNLGLRGKLFYCQNYWLTQDGKPMMRNPADRPTENNYNLVFDINLEIPTLFGGNSVRFPIIIDPTSGNNGGSEP